ERQEGALSRSDHQHRRRRHGRSRRQRPARQAGLARDPGAVRLHPQLAGRRRALVEQRLPDASARAVPVERPAADEAGDAASAGGTAQHPQDLHPCRDGYPTIHLVAPLIALAKKGGLTYASTGNGTPPHVAGEMLKRAAKVDITHVPYKGSAAAVQDVVSGQVPMMFINVPSGLSLVTAGKLRALAVGTS